MLPTERINKAFKKFLEDTKDFEILLVEHYGNNYMPPPLNGWFFMRTHKNRYMIKNEYSGKLYDINKMIEDGNCIKYPL